jgi:phosphoglucomutase
VFKAQAQAMCKNTGTSDEQAQARTGTSGHRREQATITGEHKREQAQAQANIDLYSNLL